VRPFAYVRPTALAEAFDVLAAHGADARVMAGGTDVMIRLRAGHMRPAVLLDIKDIRELSDRIVETDGVLRFGALVTMTDVLADERVQRHFGALAEAALVVGSIQIRNRATLVGNSCNASPAGDTPPALLVYGATVNLVGAAGRRTVQLSEFFTGPGKTVKLPSELVESIDVPLPSGRAGAAFGRITRRYGVDLATINLCCRVDTTGETRFAYGAVAPKPILVIDTSGVLADPKASADAKSAVLRQLIGHASPITDIRGGRNYRLGMLDVMSRRTLALALERL
jgi:CO/xanthine dehydrogenase FAD-binding subunit